jgi:hypothetical protein
VLSFVQGIRTTRGSYTGRKVEYVDTVTETRVWMETGAMSLTTGVMLLALCRMQR